MPLTYTILFENPDIPSTSLDHGWELNTEGKLSPKKHSKPALPNNLLELVHRMECANSDEQESSAKSSAKSYAESIDELSCEDDYTDIE